MNRQEKMTMSKRELECLFWLSNGFTAKETAREMGISPRTVEYYIGNIRMKTNLHRKSHLIQFFRGIERVRRA